VDLKLAGFEMKCEKCKRVLNLKNYTEKILECSVDYFMFGKKEKQQFLSEQMGLWRI
jgi:hypothetical protein